MMKMKFNWGTGILIVIVIFLVAVIAFFIFINSLDINLVEDNYYEKELVYQERIDKINNTSALAGKIKITQEPGFIIIQFPDIDSTFIPEGSLLFYRPSDPGKDFTVPLQLSDSLRQAFVVSGLDKGRWMLKLDWKMGGNEYYFEEGVIIEH
jgi:hypothetical protein